MDHILFIHSSFDGLWGCFNLLDTGTSAAVKGRVQVPVSTPVSIPLDAYTGVGLAVMGLEGGSFENAYSM